MSHAPIDYQHFFQQLLEALLLPLVIVDASLVIRFSNGRAQALFDAHVPLEGQSLKRVIHDDDILRLIRRSIETRQPVREERLTGEAGKLGGRVWLVSVKPMEHSGTARSYQYYAVVIEDLTELRRLERIRRDFVANISHELRT